MAAPLTFIATGSVQINAGVRIISATDSARVARLIVKAAAHEDAAATRLRDEFRLAVRVRHAGVVRVRALESDDAELYLLMDDANGVPILDWLQGAARVRPNALVDVFTKLALALAAVHDESVLHLDLSPANVLVTVTGQPVLVDFGQAIDADQPHPTQGGGTDGYCAPEVARYQVPTAAADWYSWGCLLASALKLDHELREDVQLQLHELARRLRHDDPRQRPPRREVLEVLRQITSRTLRYRLRLPFIGRHLERAALQEAFDHVVQQRTPRLVCINGEAGHGKTRLVREFLRAQRKTIAVIEHASVPDRGDEAQLFDGIAASFAAQLDQSGAAPRCDPATAKVLSSVFAPMRRFAITDAARAHGAANAFERIRAEMALLDLIELQFRPWSVILWLDDVQWASHASLASLMTSIGQITQGALLVIATLRPDAVALEIGRAHV